MCLFKCTVFVERNKKTNVKYLLIVVVLMFCYTDDLGRGRVAVAIRRVHPPWGGCECESNSFTSWCFRFFFVFFATKSALRYRVTRECFSYFLSLPYFCPFFPPSFFVVGSSHIFVSIHAWDRNKWDFSCNPEICPLDVR